MQLKCSPDTAVCVGNESVGLAASVLKAVDDVVRIPLKSEKLDSLNVSTAGAIALYCIANPRL
jgi:tRNA G18 (ribose-2'-O)-methylase SpoU